MCICVFIIVSLLEIHLKDLTKRSFLFYFYYFYTNYLFMLFTQSKAFDYDALIFEKMKA